MVSFGQGSSLVVLAREKETNTEEKQENINSTQRCNDT